MAARRVRYTKPPSRAHQFGPQVEYGSFVTDLLSGRVTATRLIAGAAGNGHPQFDYDDPTGVGPRAVAAVSDTGTRSG